PPGVAKRSDESPARSFPASQPPQYSGGACLQRCRSTRSSPGKCMSTVRVCCPGSPSARQPGGVVAVGCRLVRAAALAWVFLGTSQGPALAGDPLRRDLRLTILARDALQRDPVFAPWEIAVHVQNGVASLTGEVPS